MIETKRHNYLFSFINKKWKQRKMNKRDKKVKLLETRATLNALLYWVNLLLSWYMSCFFISIATRINAGVSLVLLSVSSITFISWFSSIFGILISKKVHKIYEEAIEKQILKLFQCLTQRDEASQVIDEQRDIENHEEVVA